ncbi:MAG: GNAT family N-acetyltransferase [Candidatus Heimdallarchaeaceae archaeon]
MAKIEIKELQGEDIDPVIKNAQYAFYPSPGDLEKLLKNKPYFKEDLCLVLYENDEAVSSLKLKPLTQNVRGKIKSMCGVGDVATNPKARRKGYVKKLMMVSFQKMKAKNQVFSTLYPFKESFYEKFGYISFPQVRTAIFSPQALTKLLKLKLDECVERVSISEGFLIYRDFLKDYQSYTHGMGLLPDTELERFKDESRYWLVYAKDENNKVIGIMTYAIKGLWKELVIRHFYYKNSLGKYLFLQWLALHADQVKEIHMPIKPDENPELWYNDAFWGINGKIISRNWVPSCMGRVVIIDQLSGLTVGDEEIAIKVLDEHCKWNNDTFLFKGYHGKLIVSRTTNFDCTLSIQGLSALVYGCYNLEDFDFKNWGSLSEENKKSLEKLFPKKHPYLHVDF